MTPEEKQQLETLTRKVDQLLDVYYRTHFIDRDVFGNPVYFNNKVFIKDGVVISIGTTTGLKIGNAVTEKVAFFGETPVAQQTAITAPSGGATIDSEARTAINSIRTVLSAFGFTA